jgi:hypothetical protein
MITSCDPINPYTTSATFGVSYNGGYKPDRSLKWIPPDTNVVDERDDFVPPPLLPPPNMLMQTCEGKRIDPRVGGIPKRDIQYDDFTENVNIQQVPPPETVTIEIKDQDVDPRLLMFIAVLLLVLLFMTRFS